jgi:hypothetical protein
MVMHRKRQAAQCGTERSWDQLNAQCWNAIVTPRRESVCLCRWDGLSEEGQGCGTFGGPALKTVG